MVPTIYAKNVCFDPVYFFLFVYFFVIFFDSDCRASMPIISFFDPGEDRLFGSFWSVEIGGLSPQHLHRAQISALLVRVRAHLLVLFWSVPERWIRNNISVLSMLEKADFCHFFGPLGFGGGDSHLHRAQKSAPLVRERVYFSFTWFFFEALRLEVWVLNIYPHTNIGTFGAS